MTLNPLPVNPYLFALRRGLIVSCQAPADSPLHDPIVIAAMAQAALNQGAVGLRIDSPAHLVAVRNRRDADATTAQVPIIGIWKQQLPGCEVYITPRFEDATAIAAAGADIIAIDATLRNRPNGETLSDIIAGIHQELGKLVMADVDTLEAGIKAARSGADVVATTLYGYTTETKHLSPPGFELLAQLVEKLSVPVICEGGIASPQMAKQALDLGAHAVVVGTDITGIDSKVKAYQAVIGKE